MAKGLYLMRDGQALVEYGKRRVPISPAQYRANGYRPPCDKLRHEALPEGVAEAEFAMTTLEGRTKAWLGPRDASSPAVPRHPVYQFNVLSRQSASRPYANDKSAA